MKLAMQHDIRWLQRFNNYKKAYAQLADAIAVMEQRELSNLEKQGIIQAFEFNYELAWNVLRDYLIWQGSETISGSRDAIREAFKRDLINDGHAWLAMLQDRNRTVHTYNEETANQIIDQIRSKYFALFTALLAKFNSLSEQFDDRM